MFQSLNQFIVLASLLSAGIGGLAAPTRRQEGPVTIFSQGTKLCLDAGQGIFATRLVFDGCTGNVNQEWNLRQTSTGLSTIESVSSTLCAGIAGEFVTLQACDSNPENLDWSILLEGSLIGIPNLGLCMELNENNEVQARGCDIFDSDQKMQIIDA